MMELLWGGGRIDTVAEKYMTQYSKGETGKIHLRIQVEAHKAPS